MNDPKMARYEVERLAKLTGVDRGQLNATAARFVMMQPQPAGEPINCGEWHARCAKCDDSFWWKLYHETELLDGLTAHPLCEECYAAMAPADRLPFYSAFFDWYIDDQTAKWKEEYRATHKVRRQDIPDPPQEFYDTLIRKMDTIKAIITKG